MKGEILKSLSDPHSSNQAYLFDSERHGLIVKKQFSRLSNFKRAVEAFKAIDRSLHPSIYKIDMKHRILYMSYDPIEQHPESLDQCVAELLKRLHESTIKYAGVSDPGTGERYSSWKAFMKKKGEWAVQLLGSFHDYGDIYEKWINRLDASAFEPVSYIHGSISQEQIGQRKGNYLLLGFDNAILGDPYWDVACYALEYANAKEVFFNQYGVKDREKVDALLHLAALNRAAFFYQQEWTEAESFHKYLSLLNE